MEERPASFLTTPTAILIGAFVVSISILIQGGVIKLGTPTRTPTANLKACVEGEKYKDEVQKDLADGSSVGVNGTPSFFAGKSDPSGIIEGTIIVGAQPYAAFQAAIDPLLK